jgi:diguanylate cyclase (GGDEF)-like protein
VLKAIARVLTSGLRGSDVAARLGGDEMCLLLPETGVNGGEITVARLQKAIENLVVRKDSNEIMVTASFGGCTWHVENYDKDKLSQIMKSNDADNIMHALIEAADQAMYKSKQGGRNTTNWTTLNLTK